MKRRKLEEFDRACAARKPPVSEAEKREIIRQLWAIRARIQGMGNEQIMAELASGRVDDSPDRWHTIAFDILMREYGYTPAQISELTAEQAITFIGEIEARYSLLKGAEPDPEPVTPKTVPLPDKQRRVLEILQSLKQGDAIPAQHIADTLADGTSNETVRNTIKKLRKAEYPIEWRAGAGYYLSR